jgi:methyl-accepting chemotaxis protein
MFKKLSLALKISGMVTLIIIALIIVSGVGFSRISGIKTIVSDLSDVHIPLLNVASDIDVSATEQELVATQYSLHRDDEFLLKFKKLDESVDQLFEKAKTILMTDQELVDEGWLEPLDKMAAQHDVFVTSCNALINAINTEKPKTIWDPLADEMVRQSEVLMEHIDGFLDINTKESEAVSIIANASAVSGRYIIGIVAALSITIGIVLAFFITRGITRPLNLIIQGLNEGAIQVSAASGQVSSSSQSLAEGSSEQAASIEETSSSMEEMASMTSKNAENASHADSLMTEANSIVTTANHSMAELTGSMEDISKASDETSKIIKTIDEIAFQTNLLALNAAVEAARAGEAGAGFAVVADEVRNLAMRAADAAKDTAQLIEGTVKKVTNGSQLVASTNKAFDKVADSSEKVGSLIAEISEASKEQSIGIEQVNTAINEMDKIVQQNAANAEESASASEEMNAQAEQLKDYVGDLVTLNTGKEEQSIASSNYKAKAVSQSLHHTATDKKKILAYNSNEIRPDQLIPLDGDSDFKDF